MTGTGTNLFSDIVFVSLKASAIAAAAVPPAVVAPHSDPALTGDASAPAAALGLSANGLLNRPSVAALCERLPKCDDEQTAEDEAEAGRGDSEVPFGRIDFVAHDTPINSAPRSNADELIKDFGIQPVLSSCHFGIPSDTSSIVKRKVSARQPSFGVSFLDLPAPSSGVAGLSARAIIKNAIAFLVVAASEIISNSTSSVGA